MFALVTQHVPVLLSLLVFDLHSTLVSMFIVSTFFLFWCESQLKAAAQQDEARSRSYHCSNEREQNGEVRYYQVASRDAGFWTKASTPIELDRQRSKHMMRWCSA